MSEQIEAVIRAASEPVESYTYTEDDVSIVQAEGLSSFDLRKIRVISSEVARDMDTIKAAASGNQLARNLLILSHIPTVIGIARKVGIPKRCYLDRDDLISGGFIGLIKAIDKYENRPDVKFSTYAFALIEHAMRDAVNQSYSSVSIPSNMVKKLKRVKHELDQVENMEQLSAETREFLEDGRNREYLEYYLAGAKSLDDTSEDGTALHELIPSDKEVRDPGSSATGTELHDALDEVLTSLDERGAVVIEAYYGLSNRKKLSQKYIAEKLGISAERCRQLRKKAENKLYKALKKLHLSADP